MRAIDVFLCAPPLGLAVSALRNRAGGGACRGTASSPMAALDLVLQHSRDPERLVTVTRTTTIGSAPSNGIQADVDGVDRSHARLELTDGRWTVSDMGSTKGIWVNESPAFSPPVVVAGDVMHLGSLAIRVVRVVGSREAVCR
jgi:hypothetical protein